MFKDTKNIKLVVVILGLILIIFITKSVYKKPLSISDENFTNEKSQVAEGRTSEELNTQNSDIESVATTSGPFSIDSNSVDTSQQSVDTNPDGDDLLLNTDSVPGVESESKVEPKVTTGITAVEQSHLLSGFNLARNQKGLSSLTWSASVAESAQSWADTLASQGCLLTHGTDIPYGENLFTMKSSNQFTLSMKAATDWWLAEESNYNYTTNSCLPGKVCGHYTQIVWKDTTSVGCGISQCSTNGFQKMLVCRFSPKGNTGTKPY